MWLRGGRGSRTSFRVVARVHDGTTVSRSTREMGPRPHVLCVMQLPPPVHGVTTINAQIATSPTLAEHFELDVLPLQFSNEISELGLVTVEKLLRAGSVAARLAWHLATRRPAAVYFTLAVQRPAIYRDLALLSLVRAAGVRRIVHL